MSSPGRPPGSDPASVDLAGTRPPRRGPMALAVGAGLAAGLASWLLGETSAVVVPPARNVVNLMGSGFLAQANTPEALLAAMRQTSARAFGVLGALTGLLLGLAGGLAGRSTRRAATAGGVGLLLGGVVGAGLPWATIPAFESWRLGRADALVPSLLMHGACWVPIGAVGGLTLGLGRGDRIRAGLAAGAAGAALATVLYEILGAALSPLSETGDPISRTWATRMLARLLVPTLAAAAATSIAARPGGPAEGPV